MISPNYNKLPEEERKKKAVQIKVTVEKAARIFVERTA
jgi:hypothetical protein